MLKKLAVKGIEFYQTYLSSRKCPHDEHCSDFGKRVIKEEGVLTGGARTFARILACYRKDADDYAASGTNIGDLAALAWDAYRFKHLVAFRGGVLKLSESDIDHQEKKENWLEYIATSPFYCCNNALDGCESIFEIGSGGG